MAPAFAGELPSAAALFEQVEGRFNHLQSLSYQVKRSTSSKAQTTEDQWQFRFRQPDKVRIDYRLPQQRLLICDGQTLVEYVPAARKALKTDLLALGLDKRNALLQGVMGRLAIAGLRLGDYRGMLRSATAVKSVQWNNASAYLVEGTAPRFMVIIDQQRMVLLRVEIFDESGKLVVRSDAGNLLEVAKDFWFPQEIRSTMQSNGEYVNSVVKFSDVRVNEAMADDLYRFVAPAGVEIITN